MNWEKKKTFCLEKSQCIGIYGYNKRGKYIKEFLEGKGKKKIFFIDQNAKNILQENVYPIENLRGINQKENIVIIISLQNAVAHKDVSEEINKIGIEKIIFLPVGEKYSEKETMTLRKYYNELISGIADTGAELPLYSQTISKIKIKNANGIISQNMNFTVFWMNIHNLYITDDKECFVDADESYLGKPVILADYYQAFFRFLKDAENNELVEKYMRIQGYKKLDGSYDDKILAGRHELWSLYREEINVGMEFFCSSPVRVQPNDRGGFDVLDGLHRTTFLYMKDLKYIPVILKTEVFQEWYTESNLDRLKKYMEKNAIHKLRTPIEHPAFYHFPCEREKQEPSVLSAIQKYIGKLDSEMWDVIDISDYNSYFARMMSKRKRKPGSGHICAVETDEKMFTLAKYINEVLHIKDVEIILQKDILKLPERKYKVVFALERWSGKNFSREVIEFIDRITEETLFWENTSSAVDEEITRILRYTSFKEYRLVFQYFDGKQCKNVYVLKK